MSQKVRDAIIKREQAKAPKTKRATKPKTAKSE